MVDNDSINIKLKLNLLNKGKINTILPGVQSVGLKRNTIDKYYTSVDVATKCAELIKQHVTIAQNDMCIEPSAGNGAFIQCIKTLFTAYIFYDLEPEHGEIKKQDYLSLDTTDIEETYNRIHIVGNPPFGRQSSLAIKFIKKSTKYCDSISFILPKSFKKNSLKKFFPLNFHLILEYDIPKNSFLVNGKQHDVPCVFQIWVKKDIKRTPPVKLIPKHFTFVKKNKDHDISFRRVGVYAGKIDIETENKSTQSHYFIKFKDVEVNEELLEKIKNIYFECSDYTVGQKSISKQELIKEFNKLFPKE